MALTINANPTTAAAVAEVVIPEAVLARVGVREDGTPHWVCVRKGIKEYINVPNSLAKDLESQYAIGGFRSNFNLSNVEPEHKVWFLANGMKDGWMNRAAGKDHIGFTYNPTPTLDTKGISPEQMLAKFAPTPRSDVADGLSMFTGRRSRVRRG